MHIINFLLAIFIPYFSLFHRIGPTGVIPSYFFSREAAFISSLFAALVFYWAGFLRYKVEYKKWTEKDYFILLAIVLIFFLVSKIILAYPYYWVASIFAYGLGWLSVSYGQVQAKIPLRISILLSLVLLAFSGFILIGMAWFNFTPKDYYYYKFLVYDFIQSTWNYLEELADFS